MIKRFIKYLKSKFTKKEKYIGEFLEKKSLPEEKAAEKIIQNLSNLVEFSKKPVKFKVQKKEADQFFFELPSKKQTQDTETQPSTSSQISTEPIYQSPYQEQTTGKNESLTSEEKKAEKEVTETKEGLFNMFN